MTILRGKSQSGSMKAQDAIEHQVATCLCSDHTPASLLAAMFMLGKCKILALPEAVRLASLNPANTLDLKDRGEIAVNKRADLICMDQVGNFPQVRHVWVPGKSVYQAVYSDE